MHGSAFLTGRDVYIDFPAEDVMFHYVVATGTVFRRFYDHAVESEIPHASTMLRDAILTGVQISEQEYNSKRKPQTIGMGAGRGHGNNRIGKESKPQN